MKVDKSSIFILVIFFLGILLLLTKLKEWNHEENEQNIMLMKNKVQTYCQILAFKEFPGRGNPDTKIKYSIESANKDTYIMSKTFPYLSSRFSHGFPIDVNDRFVCIYDSTDIDNHKIQFDAPDSLTLIRLKDLTFNSLGGQFIKKDMLIDSILKQFGLIGLATLYNYKSLNTFDSFLKQYKELNEKESFKSITRKFIR